MGHKNLRSNEYNAKQYFLIIKILDAKNFWLHKILLPKQFWAKNILDPNNFLSKNIFGKKNGSKIFVLENFRSKKIE